MLRNHLTNSMGDSSSCKANSCSASQKIPRLFYLFSGSQGSTIGPYPEWN